ncbi:efflux RND transporter permease subunit [Ralstonia solanacearum]|uniref:efflux RND transporter permease subunit n=1 Tax=Ralstonia solanacearum TaxID=305 RepID=UPI0001D94295|nr:efflux RND transporter permease subunit [Ralstonia solanacearum]MDB0511665.1 efflux RND transporter permease subunit [Ralstonia solanacearum]MDB0516258.1 efflux RND transporter permease subunit [Ralstonia solanacearum]MDB0527596.1 efflux RND transporter permease subunit [Ralstonia solanacearum]QTY24952.1 efflux RND transporter permease subunit [Ralstonia solanacearum]CBJ42838.1 putative multidrug efflux transporter AcrB transmembrane domain [Ralstonia solanacearum CFBP2957]
MNFATWSIRNPVPALLLFILLTLAGLYGFRELPIANLPDLDLPTVTISLTQPGAAPAQLETEVARKVENSLATLSGIKHMRTSITDGQVSITLEFILEKKLSDALIETKDAVDRIRSDLPVDLQQPSISAVRIGGEATLLYAIASSRMPEEALSWFVDDTVNKTVLGVPGVGKFERVGGVQRQVRVEVDPVRLAALGATAVDVSRALKTVEQESSGGRGQLGGAEQAVRTIATVRQAEELNRLPLVLSDGRRVNLDQVATVSDAIAERTQIALLDGKPVVGFKIYRAKGFDETRIAAGVAQALGKLQAANPGLSFTKISGTVDYTQEQFEGSMHMLYEGALLAVLVVWWFLRDWRATLISASALPLSILPAFAAMYWLGYSLNTLTLLALAVIVGILVDDAIVEIENIERHSRMGKPIKQAAGEAVTEIALAVMATTMTLVVVFMPTAMMSGVPGLFFKQFGWTAVVAVLSSLLVARVLTPMLAAYLLKPHAGTTEAKDGALMTRYLGWVRWCLAHRRLTLVAAVAIFIGSAALVPLLKTGLIPPSDRGYSSVSVELPPGSSLAATRATTEAARRAMGPIKGIDHVMTMVGDAQAVGGGQTQAGEVRRATMTLVLAPRGERPSQADIETQVRRALINVPGARFSLGVGGPGEKMSLILASEDTAALKATGQALERQLRGVPGLANVTSTASLERPEIVVRPNAQRAAEQGVTTAAIGETVRIATNGDFDAQVAKLNLDNRQVPIQVRIPDAARQDMDVVANLRVHGRNGLVPLASVADIAVESGPSQIDRYDRRRYVTVSADLGGTPLGQALAEAKALPAAQAMPSSVKLIETGDAEIMMELLGGFGMAIVIGLLCVFCVLVLLFHDFFQPLTILSAVPLSLGGAFVALLLSKGMLSIPSMIGLVMLMGIVTKNSILLVEYAVVGIQERGLSLHEALIDACHKRARPIVMTTVAMIAGMLPIALGLGADASFRQPMAIAVIGGLVTSTGLSLLVVPVAFTYVDGLERRVRRFFSGSTAHTGALPEDQEAAQA